MKQRPIRENRLVVYRHRKLPHWQAGGSWYFVTYRAMAITLTAAARDAVRESIVKGHGGKYRLAAAVVMPDHAHLLFRPKEKGKGLYHSLAEIMKPLKGIQARAINRLLGRTGPVWQKESFDRIVRDEKEWREKYEYIRNNPVKEGLAARPEDYLWLIAGEGFENRY